MADSPNADIQFVPVEIDQKLTDVYVVDEHGERAFHNSKTLRVSSDRILLTPQILLLFCYFDQHKHFSD